MQAIITKFYGPTNSKGARIKAECAAGKIFVSYEYGMNTQDNHWNAAKALINKLEWNEWDSNWICGGSPDATGFVFVNDGIRTDVYNVSDKQGE